MEGVKILHASDLHLGAPFQGLGPDAEEWVIRRCRQATYEAWQRIVDLALKEAVDLVTLGGNLLDRESTLFARAELLAGLERLSGAGIPAVLVAGEQDPLSSGIWSHFELPQRARFLRREWSRYHLRRGDRVVAVVHGRSYEPKEKPGAVARDAAHAEVLQIGLVHCSAADAAGLNGASAGRGSVGRREGRLDGWLLGGSHTRQNLGTEDCPIHYPGNPQGLSMDEPGMRGCSLLESEGRRMSLRFLPTGPVVWQRVAVDISGAAEPQQVQHLVLDRLAAERSRKAELILVELVLSGASRMLDRRAREGLFSKLSAELGRPLVLVGLRIETEQASEFGTLRQQQGSFLREVVLQGDAACVPGRVREELLRILSQAASDGRIPSKELPQDAERWLDELLPRAVARAVAVLSAEESR
jgi:DNA repair exonuclease SbcCD nuclease subunit